MERIMKFVKLYYVWQKKNIKSELQYRKDFLVSSITVSLQPVISLISFYVFTSKFSSLGGWTFWEITFLYSLWRIVEGAAMTFFQQSWDIGNYIVDGTFDRFLIKPISPILHLFCVRFQKISFAQMCAGIILFIISVDRLNLILGWTQIAFLFISIISGMFLYMGICLGVSSLAFWFTKVYGILSIVTNLNYEFMQYPLSIYPTSIKIILTVIVPYAFMSYIPAQVILGEANTILVKISPIVGIGVFFLAIMVFNLGLSKYNSTGN